MKRSSGKPPSTYLSAGFEMAIAAAGILFLAFALLADQDWWDRHFLPRYFFSHEKYVMSEWIARLAAGAIGIILVFLVRPVVGRVTSRMSVGEIAAGLLRIMLAIGLALAATEWTMGHKFAYAAAETQPGEEPIRQPDPRLGWVFTPAHDGRITVGGREITPSSVDRTPYGLDESRSAGRGRSGLTWFGRQPAAAKRFGALTFQNASIRGSYAHDGW